MLIKDKEVTYKLINDNIKPKTFEKNKYGEVFTPIKLIEEMYSKLPNEIWSNQNLKWFDPAVGIGNFMIVAYYNLMDNLTQITDENARSEHIIKNMLYMSELNPNNTKVIKQIFGDTCNIYEGDTLKIDTVKLWDIEKFDIIVGNPPFNSAK